MDMSPGNVVVRKCHGRFVVGLVWWLASASCGGGATHTAHEDAGGDQDAVAGEDAVPRTVGACAQLAPAGTWENVSPLPGSMPMPENEGMWGAAAIVAHPMVDGTLY